MTQQTQKEISITINCDCGTTYTIKQGEYIVCPKCHKPPLLLWNAIKQAHQFGGICTRTAKV